MFHPKGIIFDMDGTLTRPGTIDFELIRKRVGCPEGYPIIEYIDSLSEKSKELAYKKLHEIEMKAAQNAEPNIGAKELLSYLHQKGIATALVTRNSLSSTEVTFKNFKGIYLPKIVITREMAPPKPDPEGLILAAYRMHISPGNILVVGDYKFDIIAGKGAGMKTALLTNGRREVPRDFPDADFLFVDLLELKNWLDSTYKNVNRNYS